ncbi:hypothetical protein SOM10_12140 [Microbacterium sp. CFBP9023]|uniref:hypothetical protein n=1 Tax=Microbacterium sp. CFBP9023 TaxID=3096535 RepID=UPI002A6B7F6F|nr:hypothetical protein [Microbacterium sp. CFBP9023]MDY0984646.1 hypothetical protein [Microbacterium sp. CFBP9023]
MTFLNREERREARSAGWYTLRWFIAILIAALVVGGGLWWLNVATSGIRGQGDGVVQRNSAENWLDAQARFENNYAEYESTLVRIDVAYNAHIASPDDKTLEQTYLGTVGYCTGLVADYNADARDFLREDFRAADLPASLDASTCTKE